MKITNKKFFLNSSEFKIKEAGEGGDQESLTVEGYASTVSKDRHGDVILPEVWKQAGSLDNFQKNPIVLYQHDHDEPIGKVEAIEVDDFGLKVKAVIYNVNKAFALVSKGVLKTFSVGFWLKDLDFSETRDAWIVKELELFEVSIVSVPANPTASFSLAKSLSSELDLNELKQHFIEDTMEKDNKKTSNASQETPNVDAGAIAAQVRKEMADEAAREKAAAEAKDAERNALKADVIGEVTSRFDALEAKFAGLLEKHTDADSDSEKSALKQQLDELQEQFREQKAAGREKGEFTRNRMNEQEIKATDIDAAVIIAANRKGGAKATDTNVAKRLLEKSGREHWEAGTNDAWEDDFLTRLFDELRRELVVENAFTNIPMTAQRMFLPINPEARYAEFIQQSAYRGPNSTGTAEDHKLKEQELIAYKLAAKEYLGYEEDEDSMIPLIPLIRSNLQRSLRRSSDRALLRGAGTAADPIKGLTARAVTAGATRELAGGASGVVTVNSLALLRRELGAHGLNPQEVAFMISMKAYYDIIDDDNLKTVDVAGSLATQFTGQIGVLHGSPVIVTSEFDDAAIEAGTVDTPVAVAVKRSNFLVGNWRNLMMETDRDIEEQKNILVATRRFGMTDIEADSGVSVLRVAT